MIGRMTVLLTVILTRATCAPAHTNAATARLANVEVLSRKNCHATDPGQSSSVWRRRQVYKQVYNACRFLEQK